MIKLIQTTMELKQENEIAQEIGFVPTMGNLHSGHLSLIERSLSENLITVVSIFVNPTQFAAGEDFETYPRTLEADIEKIKSICGDNSQVIIFAPKDDKEIYPNGKTLIKAIGPTHILEGALRPEHFDGVATVVKRLFEIVKPTRAYFGKKDYQQLQIIKNLVKNENLPIDIIGMPIKRDSNGLALSSRNQYLTKFEKENALMLSKALFELRDLILAKKSINEVEEQKKSLMQKGDYNYLEICDQETLNPITEFTPKMVILGNLKVGNTKLLDNIEVEIK